MPFISRPVAPFSGQFMLILENIVMIHPMDVALDLDSKANFSLLFIIEYLL